MSPALVSSTAPPKITASQLNTDQVRSLERGLCFIDSWSFPARLKKDRDRAKTRPSGTLGFRNDQNTIEQPDSGDFQASLRLHGSRIRRMPCKSTNTAWSQRRGVCFRSNSLHPPLPDCPPTWSLLSTESLLHQSEVFRSHFTPILALRCPSSVPPPSLGLPVCSPVCPLISRLPFKSSGTFPLLEYSEHERERERGEQPWACLNVAFTTVVVPHSSRQRELTENLREIVD